MVYHHLLVRFNILSLDPFKSINWNPSDQSEKFMNRFFIVVPFPGKPDPDPFWDVSGTVDPDLFVQVSVNKREMWLKRYLLLNAIFTSPKMSLVWFLIF